MKAIKYCILIVQTMCRVLLLRLHDTSGHEIRFPLQEAELECNAKLHNLNLLPKNGTHPKPT